MLESQIFYEDYTWYVKLIDEHNNTRYVEIDVDISSIESIEQLFEIIRENLPEGYEIADEENLYTINDLPCEYWDKPYNPPCFESESFDEYDWGSNYSKKNKSYFDSIMESF